MQRNRWPSMFQAAPTVYAREPRDARGPRPLPPRNPPIHRLQLEGAVSAEASTTLAVDDEGRAQLNSAYRRIQRAVARLLRQLARVRQEGGRALPATRTRRLGEDQYRIRAHSARGLSLRRRRGQRRRARGGGALASRGARRTAAGPAPTAVRAERRTSCVWPTSTPASPSGRSLRNSASTPPVYTGQCTRLEQDGAISKHGATLRPAGR
jgi:hypothetical protein